jgi:hypothetical protein
MWAANLVLATEPRWLRHFHLFDLDPAQVRHLYDLKAAQPEDPKRTIDVYEGALVSG